MEFKCSFCGKNFTDPEKYTVCVNECLSLRKQREELERRKKAQTEFDQTYEEFMKQYSKCLELAKKMYKLNPSAEQKGVILSGVWPAGVLEIFEG